MEIDLIELPERGQYSMKETLYGSVGRAWRSQRQDSGFDSLGHPYVKCMQHDCKSLWIIASAKYVCEYSTCGSGGNRALDTLYRLVSVNWIEVLVNRSSCMLVDLSLGQMSLSPENGDTVMVFFSSY